MVAMLPDGHITQYVIHIAGNKRYIKIMKHNFCCCLNTLNQFSFHNRISVIII